MKKTIPFFMAIFAAVLLLSSCKKECECITTTSIPLLNYLNSELETIELEKGETCSSIELEKNDQVNSISSFLPNLLDSLPIDIDLGLLYTAKVTCQEK